MPRRSRHTADEHTADSASGAASLEHISQNSSTELDRLVHEHIQIAIHPVEVEIDRLNKEVLVLKEQVAKQRLKQADQLKDLRKLVDLLHKRLTKK